MIYDIRQFRLGESDVTKIRLSAVSNAIIIIIINAFDNAPYVVVCCERVANEFIQETRRT